MLKRRTHVWIDVYTGDGNLANVPWIAFVDERETENVLGDVYCVLLFKADMSGVYLTVNQGSVMAKTGFLLSSTWKILKKVTSSNSKAVSNC